MEQPPAGRPVEVVYLGAPADAGYARVEPTPAPAAPLAAVAAPSTPSAPAVAQVDAAELMAQHMREFEAEAIDPRWATDTRFALMNDLMVNSRSGELVDVECRSHQCMATLRWANYQDARSDMTTLVTGYYGGLNCGQGMSLPTERPGEETEAQLFFDCRHVANNGYEELQ
jgi:hypothetical protein